MKNKNNHKLTDYDKKIIEQLFEDYGSEELFNVMNERVDYNYTGGSVYRGLKGLVRSVPSLALMSVVSLPLTLICAVGALSHRIQKSFDDRESWLNTLDPRYWGEYLGTRYKDKKGSDNDKNDKNNEDGKIKSAVKKFLGIGTATAAGSAAGVAAAGAIANNKEIKADDIEKLKQNIKGSVFVEYWITLSNGEILRVRADSEENAKSFANLIIKSTEKTTYKDLNERISKNGFDKYVFEFDDGERCYWSADDEQKAYKEALKAREDLCKAFNQHFTDTIKLDDLSSPHIVGVPIVMKGEKIEVPKQDVFLDITTVQPKLNGIDTNKLPEPLYNTTNMNHYYLTHKGNPLEINVPGADSNDAKQIYYEYERSNKAIGAIKANIRKKCPIFKIKTGDKDRYFIWANDESEATDIARELVNKKIEAIRFVFNNSSKQKQNYEYETLLANYEKKIKELSHPEKKTSAEVKQQLAKQTLIYQFEKPTDDKHNVQGQTF